MTWQMCLCNLWDGGRGGTLQRPLPALRRQVTPASMLAELHAPTRPDAALQQLEDQAGAPQQARRNLLGLRPDEMPALVLGLGAPAFRGQQLAHWVYQRGVDALSAMDNLPRALRQRLAAECVLDRPRQDAVEVSADGTRKYRFVATDGTAFESVYIPEVARGRRTNTLCISSQSGCAVGCKFCFTASLRRNRNLSAAEIVGQVMAAQADVDQIDTPGRITNIVFMGMGEPLLNYDHVVQAARIMLDPQGLGFSSRRITISTSGIVPRLRTLGHDLPVQLAISLNASTDAVRTAIMPINKKWPLAELMASLHAYPLPPRRRITIEYVLLGGVNDQPGGRRAPWWCCCATCRSRSTCCRSTAMTAPAWCRRRRRGSAPFRPPCGPPSSTFCCGRRGARTSPPPVVSWASRSKLHPGRRAQGPERRLQRPHRRKKLNHELQAQPIEGGQPGLSLQHRPRAVAVVLQLRLRAAGTQKAIVAGEQVAAPEHQAPLQDPGAQAARLHLEAGRSAEGDVVAVVGQPGRDAIQHQGGVEAQRSGQPAGAWQGGAPSRLQLPTDP